MRSTLFSTVLLVLGATFSVTDAANITAIDIDTRTGWCNAQVRGSPSPSLCSGRD